MTAFGEDIEDKKFVIKVYTNLSQITKAIEFTLAPSNQGSLQLSLIGKLSVDALNKQDVLKRK